MNELKTVVKLMVVEKKDILYSILFGFLAGAAAVSLFANSGYLISAAAIKPPLYVLTVSIALLKLFSVTRAVSRYAERYFSHRATFTILSNLRVHFFNKIEPLAPRIFGKYRSGDLLSRIVGDVESLQNFFLRVYYPPIVMVIVFLATIVFTGFFSIPIALTLVAGLILSGFLIPLLFAMKLKGLETEIRELRGQLSTEATEFLYGFRDLKLYQRLDEQEQQLLDTSNTYIDKQRMSGIQALSNQSISQLITFAISTFILGLGAYFVVSGQLDGIFLAMLVMISLTVFENVMPMAVFPYHYEDSRRAAKRLFSVVDREDEATDYQTKNNLNSSMNEKLDDNRVPSIEIDNLSFAFPEQNRLALKNINLTITAGSKNAIVGPSGSGKSTLLQLLLKVYDNYQGEIRINGKRLSMLDDESVWKATNPVLQSNHFFHGTIRSNLLIARDQLTDEDLKEALAKVELDGFSLDEIVLEKGENLSGGEKQRLAIARAMLKGAHLWLLDEPTSSVDPLTEMNIYQRLRSQGKYDTSILVSHRLTGLEDFEQIIVMEAGQIIEMGTFEQLIEKKGHFYEMKQIDNGVFL